MARPGEDRGEPTVGEGLRFAGEMLADPDLRRLYDRDPLAGQREIVACAALADSGEAGP